MGQNLRGELSAAQRDATQSGPPSVTDLTLGSLRHCCERLNCSILSAPGFCLVFQSRTSLSDQSLLPSTTYLLL